MQNLYDQVNKCIVTSGAFVTEVFQSSRVYFLNEMHEGKLKLILFTDNLVSIV